MAYLWLTRYPPYKPLRGGAFDYSRDLIESLALTAPVHGIAFEMPEGSPPPDSRVTWTTFPNTVPPKIASLVSPLPNVASRNVDKTLLAHAVKLARAGGIEAIFVDFIAMMWAVRPLRRALSGMKDRPRTIVVSHNHEHAVRMQMARSTPALPMRAALSFDGWKAGALERGANRAADGITTIISTDGEAFAREAKTPSITVPPAYGGPVVAERTIDASVPPTMTILGNRNAHHKMMVLERTLAALDAAGLAKAGRIEIAGEGEFAPLAARYPGFHFQGYVPDLEAYLSQVRLGLLSDDIGGGFKIRAMSYAMLRVPMLALREAMYGMEFEEGVHFVGAGSLAELASIAATLVHDTQQLDALQRAAFDYAARRFDPAEPGRRMSRFVADLRPAATHIAPQPVAAAC